MKDNKDFPFFSIITVCRNAEKTIEQTIQSVLGQTFQDLEYIIIDGASNDNTMDIINRYRKKIDVVVSESDSGIYDAMNKGVALSKGEVIGIINSDDWYEPNTLELVAEKYNKCNKETIIHGLCKYYDEKKEGMILGYHHDVLRRQSIAHPTCFVPKNIYKKIGIYDPGYKVAADYEFLLRCYLSEIQFIRIDRVLANFRIGGFSSENDGQSEGLNIQLKHGVIDKKRYLIRKFIRSISAKKSKFVERICKVFQKES